MEERIVDIMKVVFDETKVNVNTTQDNLEKWDSMHHLILISELEEEFNVEFEPEEIAEMKSVEQIVFFIKQKLSSASV